MTTPINGGMDGFFHWGDSTHQRWDHWDLRMMGLAQHVAGWSKDPSTKVGAVITAPDHRIISVGFNGLPRGVADTNERLTNRDIKYKMIVHAETNAMLFAREPLDGATVYTWPFMACSSCASKIIQAGIRRHVTVDLSATDPDKLARWKDDFTLTQVMLKEAGVETVLIPKSDFLSV